MVLYVVSVARVYAFKILDSIDSKQIVTTHKHNLNTYITQRHTWRPSSSRVATTWHYDEPVSRARNLRLAIVGGAATDRIRAAPGLHLDMQAVRL